MNNPNSQSTNEGGPCEASIDDLERGALQHYEEISDKACHWSSAIPRAIKFYYAAQRAAPSDTRRTYEDGLQAAHDACEKELLEDAADNAEDHAYTHGIQDCLMAIASLQETAGDPKAPPCVEVPLEATEEMLKVYEQRAKWSPYGVTRETGAYNWKLMVEASQSER